MKVVDERPWRALRMFLVACALVSCASPAPTQHAAVSAQRPPALQAVALDGSRVDLGAALAGGRSVMLVFWQTWCASCVAEAPDLAAAAREHADDWYFVGVVPGPDRIVDDREVERVSAELHLPYSHVRDRDGAWSNALAVAGTPTLIALARDGTVGWRGNRPPADWTALHLALTRGSRTTP